jgi:hypothetical protein
MSDRNSKQPSLKKRLIRTLLRWLPTLINGAVTLLKWWFGID